MSNTSQPSNASSVFPQPTPQSELDPTYRDEFAAILRDIEAAHSSVTRDAAIRRLRSYIADNYVPVADCVKSIDVEAEFADTDLLSGSEGAESEDASGGAD